MVTTPCKPVQWENRNQKEDTMSESNVAEIVNANDTDFEAVVVQASRERPVVVDFWAPWCGPCRALAPVLEKVIAGHGGEVALVKVNIDEAPNLATQFRIEGIPLVIAFRDGKAVAEFAGVYPEPYIRDFIQKLVPTEADKLAAAAKLLETSDPAAAEQQYRKVLEMDRRHEPSLVGLARVLLELGKEAEALALLDEVGETGPLTAERDRIRGIADMRRQAQALPDEKLLRQKIQAEPKNGQALFELGCVLAAQSKYPEALEMLLSAAERDHKLAMGPAREKMVEVFHIIGDRSPMADDYREKLSGLLY
jgi:putative thioredoxin